MSRRFYTAKGILLLALCLLALLTVRCAGTAPKEAPVESGAVAEEPMMAEAPPAAPHSGYAEPGAVTDATIAQDQARMIIYEGHLTLVVKDTQESIDAIQGLLEEMDGYVAESQLWRQDDQLRGILTVRVPAERFDQALEQFKALALKVDSQQTSSQDVTEEYTDLDARLRNLEATEEELRELLRTVRERTGSAEEILAVHQRLSEVRGQIEQVKGRKQYLERLSALATITIDLTPDILSKPITVAGWRPQGTAAAAISTLIKTLQLIADMAIWLLLFILPVMLVLLLPFVALFFLWRWYRRRGARAAEE
jgi:hypothetical protein